MGNGDLRTFSCCRNCACGVVCRRRCLRSDLPSPLAIRYGGLADSPRRWFWELSCESGLPWELEFGEVRCQALIRSGVRGVLSRCRPTLFVFNLGGVECRGQRAVCPTSGPRSLVSRLLPGMGSLGGSGGKSSISTGRLPLGLCVLGVDRASPKPKPKPKKTKNTWLWLLLWL